jgi:hypothetical protein
MARCQASRNQFERSIFTEGEEIPVVEGISVGTRADVDAAITQAQEFTTDSRGATGSTQPFACREAIDSGDAWAPAVPVVHANRTLIIVIGDNGYSTPSLSEEIGERTKVVGVFAGHAGYIGHRLLRDHTRVGLMRNRRLPTVMKHGNMRSSTASRLVSSTRAPCAARKPVTSLQKETRSRKLCRSDPYSRMS